MKDIWPAIIADLGIQYGFITNREWSRRIAGSLNIPAHAALDPEECISLCGW
jgi:hypothetical protein